MTPSVVFSTTIMAIGIFAAIGWSILRATRTTGNWRLTHVAQALLMLAGCWAIWQGSTAAELLTGTPILLIALAVLFLDRTPGRMFAIVQLIFGFILASGLPLFGS